MKVRKFTGDDRHDHANHIRGLLDVEQLSVQSKTLLTHLKASSLSIRHMFQFPEGYQELKKGIHRQKWTLSTLNSFMIGTISSSRASLVTSPPRRSILFPTKITGT